VAGARVRRLRDGDIDRAIALTDLEGWGYTRGDFRLLRALSPEGCFAAEVDGRVVGVLSTTAYGSLAFLGAVVVDPAFRGRGIGAQLMEAALAHLDRLGIETVRLNSYLHVVAFYERLGFRKEFENIRWQGAPAEARSTGVRPAERRDFPHLLRIDEASFGASRRDLLTRLHGRFPRSFLVAGRDGELVGYLVGNTASLAVEIGPWVVRAGHPEVARDLFHGLMACSSGANYAFTAPTPNRDANAFAESLGYQEAFRTVRMVRGTDAYQGVPEAIWGFAGLEKG